MYIYIYCNVKIRFIYTYIQGVPLFLKIDAKERSEAGKIYSDGRCVYELYGLFDDEELNLASKNLASSGEQVIKSFFRINLM